METLKKREGLATVNEAMAFLHISRMKFYRMINDGSLPTVKLGGARRVAWDVLYGIAANGTTQRT